jgi:predicted enzyme related to lactoylglutathione lyase
MNSPSYFEIQADNIERARNFYANIFGWKFSRDENLPIEYWRIETDGPRGGLLPRPAPTPKMPAGTNAFVNSMQVEHFDATAEKILAAGGIVALPKFAVPGKCFQGYFLDTEGNTFGLYEVDANAK